MAWARGWRLSWGGL